MTEPDYRALCAELLAALESWSPNGDAPSDEGAEAIAEARLIKRARAALAESEPEGPTHRITPDDFRRWWRETGSASPAPSPEMLLTANAWAQYCLDRWG